MRHGDGWCIGWAASSLPASSLLHQKPRSPMRELRAEYPNAVLPGYYSDGRTWISVDIDCVGRPGGPSEGLVLDLCDMSYRLVFSKLTKRAQREILAN